MQISAETGVKWNKLTAEVEYRYFSTPVWGEHTEVKLISSNFKTHLPDALMLRTDFSPLTAAQDLLEGAAHAGVAIRGGPQPFML